MTTVYFEDTVDVVGASLALVALILHRVTGSAVPDAIATLLIGALLTYVAVRLSRRNRALLTNQSIPARKVTLLRDRLLAADEVADVGRIEAIHLGPGSIMAAAEIALSDGHDAAAALERVRDQIQAEVPAITRLYLTPVACDRRV